MQGFGAGDRLGLSEEGVGERRGRVAADNPWRCPEGRPDDGRKTRREETSEGEIQVDTDPRFGVRLSYLATPKWIEFEQDPTKVNTRQEVENRWWASVNKRRTTGVRSDGRKALDKTVDNTWLGVPDPVVRNTAVRGGLVGRARASALSAQPTGKLFRYGYRDWESPTLAHQMVRVRKGIPPW
ncbi:hypothetical protein NMY22_g11872 [Coprinellus aureogranulatus]|nr:hypothetical protein NMY22_g11872 [Coprinellus aureogranulatus]